MADEDCADQDEAPAEEQYESKEGSEEYIEEGAVEEVKEENLESLAESKAEGKEKGEDSKREPRTLAEWVDEMYNVIKGFSKVGDNIDPYEAVKEIDGAVVVILPGLFDWPISLETFRQYSGLNAVRFDSRDAEDIHKFLTHIYESKGIKPVVVGFSDGEKRLCNYLKKYGDESIGLGIGVGSDKNADKLASAGKFIYINGEWDCLAPLWSAYYNQTKAPIFTVSGSHAGMMESDIAIKQIASIIKSESFKRGLPIGYVPTEMYRKAA
ncbi:MAG TPA: hypothetical protein VJI46_06805 [Candidatus Nanoarchaeia archaeon]|nr:hypothetical protein [Candidatus Nanoarchaeia archaeon]